MRMRTTLAVLLASFALVGQAHAECPQAADADKQPVAYRTAIIDGKPTLVIENEIIVCGRPARPAVAYVTAAKDVGHTSDALTLSMVPRILAAVKQLEGTNR